MVMAVVYYRYMKSEGILEKLKDKVHIEEQERLVDFDVDDLNDKDSDLKIKVKMLIPYDRDTSKP